jgi:hypothetical protein
MLLVVVQSNNEARAITNYFPGNVKKRRWRRKIRKEKKRGKMVIREKARGLFDRFMQRLLNSRLFLI